MISPYKRSFHDDVIKWKHFPRYWPFVRGIHRSPEHSPHKVQWHGAFMFSSIGARINGWVNNCESGHLRHIRPHYDATVIYSINGNRKEYMQRKLDKATCYHCQEKYANLTTRWTRMRSDTSCDNTRPLTLEAFLFAQIAKSVTGACFL